MAISETVLLARGLHLARGKGKSRRPVLNAVDCEVQAGQVLMLIGPNGAGKSTLLSVLAGDLPPDAGETLLAGKELSAWKLDELARHRAMLRQHSRLTLDFTVEEVVHLGCMARQATLEESRRIVQEAMHLTGVAGFSQRLVPSLSGGEQARTHLARVLAQLWPSADEQGPRLLLLDEPCASLDPHYQHQVCAVIREFAARTGAAVIVTMHDMNLAAQYADRILVLLEGRCMVEGTPADVLTTAFVQQCFGVDASRLESRGMLLLATQALPVQRP